MTIVFRSNSSVREKEEIVEVTTPTFEEVKITALSRHINYENDAEASKPKDYKKRSSEKLNEFFDSLKLSNRHVGHY
jgi:hypothetical protein